METNNEENKLKQVYNPFEHREVEKPVSDIRATANLIKASLGSGLLAGPLAFSNSGWGIGILGTLFVGFLCGHCIHILVKTSQACCVKDRTPSMGYAETCKAVFNNGPNCIRRLATPVSVLAEASMLCTYVGVCCIYVVLISDSLKQLVDQYVPTIKLSVEYYCLFLSVPLCVTCQIKHLKFLAVFSVFANILLFGTYVFCLYYMFRKPLTISDKHFAGNPARYPVFFATVIFAMEGVGVVMPIENEMKYPKNFTGCPSVLVAAMTVIVFLYCTLSLFGYLRYGDVLEGSITLNLPTEEWPAVCAKLFIAISIFFTYPLQFYIVIDVFNRYVLPFIKDDYKDIAQIWARILLVIFSVAVGMALPLLEQIIDLVGALFYSILGLIIPAVLETVFYYQELGKYRWILWKNLFITTCGIACLISGCTVTITDIATIMQKQGL